MQSRLTWAVIGAGRFGSIHAEVLAQLPQVKLHSICGRRAERVKPLARRLDVPAIIDYREILDDPAVEVVTIATHWREHFPIARDALQSGKHVLLEKPMAASWDECQELVTLADKSPTFLMVGHVCRFDPRMVLAYEAVQAGQVGKIVAMYARRNLPVAPGSIRLDKISPLMGDGIHDADLMMWLTGQAPTRVYGRQVRVHNFQYPDAGWAMLEFGTQAVGVVETVWCLPPYVPTVIDAELRVVGTEGQLTVDCGYTGISILGARGLTQPDTAYWPQVYGQRTGALAREIEYFAQCVQQNERPSVITPAEAARAVRVMEAAERSAESGMPEVLPS